MKDNLKELREFMDAPLAYIYQEKWEALAPRQKEVAHVHVFSNMIQKNEARTLGIAYHTYKNHITEIHRKLGVDSFGRQRLMSRVLRELMHLVNDALENSGVEALDNL